MTKELKNKLLELYHDTTEYNINAKTTFKELFIIRDSLILFNEKNGHILETENIINKINDIIIGLARGQDRAFYTLCRGKYKTFGFYEKIR